MASCMIHLYTGWRYTQANPRWLDSPSFYLGCIAPDSVNTDGFADKSTRWRAHLRAETLDQWEQNVAAFALAHPAPEDPALLEGYLIHLLTDILWDRFFHDAIWSRAKQLDPVPRHGFAPGWTECFRWDRQQMQAPWWKQSVRPVLAQAHPTSINGISPALLGKYQQFVLQEYEATLPAEQPLLLSMDTIADLADRLIEEKRRLDTEMPPINR